jgi:hypothetical protein
MKRGHFSVVFKVAGIHETKEKGEKKDGAEIETVEN